MHMTKPLRDSQTINVMVYNNYLPLCPEVLYFRFAYPTASKQSILLNFCCTALPLKRILHIHALNLLRQDAG